MAQDQNSAIESGTLVARGAVGLDWNYPLGLFTSAFVLMGSSAFLRALSISADNAYFLSIVVFISWRYGVHRAGIFSWHWTGASNDPSFFFKQAFLNAIGFFAFFMAIPITL